VVVDVERDVGVAVGAVSGDGGLVRRVRLGRARATNDNLGTLGVELGRPGLVQSNQLVADQVVAGSKSGGDLAGPALVAANKLGNIPAGAGLSVKEDGRAVAVEAGLVNLEPVGAGAVARGEGAGALVHPDDDGALAVSPLLPGGRDGVARVGGGRLGGRVASVAHDLLVGALVRRVEVGPLPLDDVGRAGGVEALVSGVVLAGNVVAGDSTVGSNLGDEEGRSGQNGVGQHVDGLRLGSEPKAFVDGSMMLCDENIPTRSPKRDTAFYRIRRRDRRRRDMPRGLAGSRAALSALQVC
jgi:hypothetical protein